MDEEFWVGMSVRLWDELSLRKGQEISSEEKEEIESAVVEDGALEYALARLADKAYTEAQIKEKLEGKGHGDRVVEIVLARCREYMLLDDQSLAEALVEERKSRGYGRKWLEQKLRQIGIEDQMAKSILDETFDSTHEEKEALQALKSRYGDDPLLPDVEQRALGFLMRRGFSPGASRAAVGKQKASDEMRDKHYGVEKAQEALRKRYGDKIPDKDKARAFLARKRFSSDAIQRALQEPR